MNIITLKSATKFAQPLTKYGEMSEKSAKMSTLSVTLRISLRSHTQCREIFVVFPQTFRDTLLTHFAHLDGTVSPSPSPLIVFWCS